MSRLSKIRRIASVAGVDITRGSPMRKGTNQPPSTASDETHSSSDEGAPRRKLRRRLAAGSIVNIQVPVPALVGA